MCTRTVMVLFSLLLFSGRLEAADTNLLLQAEEAIEQVKKETRYRVVYFYRSKRNHQKITARVEKAKKKWTDVDFRVVEVTDPKEKEIVKKCGVTRVPFTTVTAPNGAMTARFPGIAKVDALEKGFVSPKMAELLKAVQSENVVFLCLANKTAQYGDEVLATARRALEKLSGIAELIEIDPRDKREAALLKQISVSSDTKIATTLVIAPTGIIVEKFTGRITERDLFDSFQKILSMSRGCGAPTATGGSACDPSAGVAAGGSCD